MGPGTVLRIIMIVLGMVLLWITLSSLSKRKMTEPFCLTWGLISLIIIFAGVLLRPAEWNRYISNTGLLLVLMIGFCVVYGAYFMSSRVSELMRKNMELAMQVSLLNEEKEEILQKLSELSEKMEQGRCGDEKNTDCD